MITKSGNLCLIGFKRGRVPPELMNGDFMDLIEYFEDLAQQVIDSNDFEDVFTPFSLIMGGANVLEKFNLFENDEQKKKIEEIRRQVNVYVSDQYPT